MHTQLRLLWFEVLESARLAKHQLLAHPTRSVLTSLGVTIGITAVTLVGGAIRGINARFNESMNMLGGDVLYVEQSPWTATEDFWLYRDRPDIHPSMADRLNDIIARTPHSLLQIAVAAPSVAETVVYDKRALNEVNLIGTTEAYSLIVPTNCQAGRFLDEVESRSGANVCVIGADIADSLFAEQDPIGKKVRIGQQQYRVVGRFERQGSFLGLLSFDSDVVIPLVAYEKYFKTGAENASIEVKVKDPKRISEAGEELRGVVRRIRGLLPENKDNFTINAQEAFRSVLAPVKTGLAAAGLFITSLALFIGAIGIMNVTFASVKERTREIGTRKALGARRRTILLQFLIEAVSISLLGGVAGLILAFVLSNLAPIAFPNFPILFSPELSGLALAVSILAGVLSGLAPARAASRLSPVQALSHE